MVRYRSFAATLPLLQLRNLLASTSSIHGSLSTSRPIAGVGTCDIEVNLVDVERRPLVAELLDAPWYRRVSNTLESGSPRCTVFEPRRDSRWAVDPAQPSRYRVIADLILMSGSHYQATLDDGCRRRERRPRARPRQ